MKLRLKFSFGQGDRLLFIGIGKSGPELNFVDKVGVIKIAGVKLKSFSLQKSEKKEKSEKIKKEKPKKEKKRTRSIKQAVSLLPNLLNSLGHFFLGLLKSIIVEEFQGKIEAGFDSPDNTGIVYGYYQAALASAPNVMSRVQYTPIWNDSGFSVNIRGSIALPLYKIIYQFSKFAISLPLRELIKLAIGTKKGAQDGK